MLIIGTIPEMALYVAWTAATSSSVAQAETSRLTLATDKSNLCLGFDCRERQNVINYLLRNGIGHIKAELI